jgi:hypothetical protein
MESLKYFFFYQFLFSDSSGRIRCAALNRDESSNKFYPIFVKTIENIFQAGAELILSIYFCSILK